MTLRMKKYPAYVDVALDIPESRIAPQMIANVKWAITLWGVEDSGFTYRHFFEIGLVQSEEHNMKAFQIVIVFLKLALIWRAP